MVTCLLIFNIEETDPFGKMMPLRSYITEEKVSEPVLKAHLPYDGNVVRDCTPGPSKSS